MHAIYLTTHTNADYAIEKGITAAGYVLHQVRSIPDAVEAIKSLVAKPEAAKWLLLVAEVQSGAIPLLMILREQSIDIPPALLFDQLGDDIRIPVQALQFDVEDYVLATDPDIQRESRARVLAERIIMDVQQAEVKTARVNAHVREPETIGVRGVMTGANFSWDPVAHIILVGDAQLRLSPIQARIFDRLWTRRNNTVTMKELIDTVLMKPNMRVEEGVRLLRPHLVRLRNKLEKYPDLAHRIINVRGNGYMMI
ncbi:MAG: response regulator transcription factor [Anaerolineae bacterium]|nr:response regulator transcription factor [Anaerolineae bacterium]